MSNTKKNIIPISVKGKKKLLAPLNIKNKNVMSASIKESIKENEVKKDQLLSSRERFELDCDNDSKEDAIFLSSLSQSEKFFYEVNAKDIYNFLKPLNLIRYIDSFIKDGFESKEDLMEIQEDYFEENKSFNKNQQKKILLKAKEYLDKYNQNNIQKNIYINDINKGLENKNETEMGGLTINNKVDMGIGGGCIDDYIIDTNIFNRCWTCFNKLKDNNYIEINYEDSIITRTVRFCSEKCQKKFEINIYTICDNCFIKYDKSKGDFIYNNKHFHSQNCLDEYFKSNNIRKDEKIDSNENIYKSSNNNVNDNNIYDPMNDF